MSIDVHARLNELVTTYGIDAVSDLLDAAPLLLESGHPGVIRQAINAIRQSEDGTLIFRVSGLPGQPPKVTWLGAGFRVVADMTVVDV